MKGDSRSEGCGCGYRGPARPGRAEFAFWGPSYGRLHLAVDLSCWRLANDARFLEGAGSPAEGR